MLTSKQISATIAYLDAPARDVDSIELASYKAGAGQLRARVIELERKLENARFFLAVACAGAALAYAAWWAGR